MEIIAASTNNHLGPFDTEVTERFGQRMTRRGEGGGGRKEDDGGKGLKTEKNLKDGPGERG